VTSYRLLARNSALNVFGLLSPLVAAVIAGPVLIASLGSARFGVLTLVWALIGYFSLFDFGIGRALTQAVSEALGRKDIKRVRDVTGVAIAAMVALGCVAGVIIAAITPWLVFRVLKMDAALHAEAATSFYVLSVSLPFVLATVGFRGLLEAHQEFGLVTALRLPYSLFNFVGPLLIIPFSRNLVPIVVALAVARMLVCAAHGYVCWRRYEWLREVPLRNTQAIAPLLRTGGWMTVSNVVNPVLIYIDRFVIGATLSLAAVAYYVTPFEVVVRLLFVPGAVIAVFFPAFAASYVQDRARTAAMIDRASRFMLFAMFPAILAFVAFAREGLMIWIGAEYAKQSAVVVQLLAVGVLVNSLGQIPQAFLQAVKRADLTAKLHLVEVPVYAVALAALSVTFGINGVALAWTLRVVMDTVVNCWMTQSQFPESASAINRSLAWLGGMLVSLLIVALPQATIVRAVLALVTLTVFLVVAWNRLLLEPERHLIQETLRLRARPEPGPLRTSE
jgi:O-antigen/teichoic acid export membrane protein